ncbi:hypothetical protein G3578_03780 [Brevibacillus sp. SYP-B805]|uniref:DUF5666 domain-containing protein n=1 Tax=Brevibacillus sp. SYP-B805 TaxID=1578199 RepID=UPI0013EB6C71|nr:DUF5666 domain-containing protein [Brevibacillus sp. SYP-B805]NGQ94294.1 hypothetical protein [Brevibacillus sp. SYP-B805]
MRKWFSMLLALMLMLTLVPLAQAHGSDGKLAGQSVKWVDKGKPDKGKPEKGKPEKKKVEKIAGKVAAVDAAAGKLTVSNGSKQVELLLTSETSIKVKDWKTATAADIWVGDQVKAEYTAADTGNTAKKIEIAKKKGVVYGKVTAVDPAAQTLTVSGKTIHVLDDASIRSGKEQLAFADIVEGDQLKAEGYLKEGTLQAVKIEVKRQAAVVKGSLQSIDAATRTLVVDGKSIVVAPDAKIRLNGSDAALEQLAVGDKVVATGKWSGKLFTARILNVQRTAVEVEGEVESVDVEGKKVTIGGKTLTVTDATKITSDDKAIALADLTVGSKAEAKALQMGEEWIALKIEVKQAPEDKEGEVEGKVEAVDAAAMTLTVGGKTVHVSDTTRISAEDHQTLTFADLAPGMEIEAKGTWKEQVLEASEINVELNDEE